MKHFLKLPNEYYSIFLCVDDITGFEVSCDTNNNIAMHDWNAYVKDRIINLYKADYKEATKEEFEAAYIAGVEKLNKITSNL